MPTVDELEKLAVQDERFLVRRIEAHQAELKRAIRKLEARILADIKELSTGPTGKLKGVKVNLIQSQKIHKQLVAHWKKTYDTAFESIVDDFDKIAARAVRRFKTLEAAGEFTAFDEVMIQRLKTATYNEFAAYGDLAQERMARAMYSHVVARSGFAELVAEVQGILRGHEDIRGISMERYATQFANDAVMNFNNSVHLAKAEQYGFEYFRYSGTIMADTRDWCLRHIGRTYSRKQIESWRPTWAGASGPAMTHRGGYNCRHTWVAVRKEWVEDEAVESTADKEKQRAKLQKAKRE